MKKAILIVFLFSPLILQAQGTRFSLIADPQFSWMNSDTRDINSQGAIMGINAGLVMDHFFAENYAFSTGLTINNLGGKLQYSVPKDFKTSSGTVTVPARSIITYRLQYLCVPVGLKFKTNEIGYTRIFTNLGVTPMLNIRSRGTDMEDVLEKDNIHESIRMFNMNYFINLGVEYSLGGATAIVGGLGYSQGFSDVTSDSQGEITIGSFNIRLGILF